MSTGPEQPEYRNDDLEGLSEMDRWLEQPLEERGLSPDRQTRQPLGFRSKRQYREESIYGYQDAKMGKKHRDQNWELLQETFGKRDEGAQGFIISDSLAKIEQNLRYLAKQEDE